MNRAHVRGAVALGLAAAASAGHVAYPAALAVLTRRRRAEEPRTPEAWPAVSVIVPAFREAGVIAPKLKSVLDDGYPGELEVVVVAEDQETADAARAVPGVRVLQPAERLGKSQALNHAVERASHDVFVMTDANNEFFPGAIAALVTRLGSETGAVTGAKGFAAGEEGGEGIYWRFESWLKEREAALGSTIGIVGELYAIRREAWRPIPHGISSDDLWTACDVRERGWKVGYAPDAQTSEDGTASLGEEWERRTRMIAGSLVVYWEKRHLITRGDKLSFELMGHRVWRSTVGPLAHVGLLGMAVVEARRSRLAQLFLLGHAVGGAAIVWPRHARPLPTPIKAGGQLLFLHAVAVGGIVRRLRGDRVVIWAKQAR